MTIRLFGSHDCDTCVTLRSEFDKRGVAYQFVDASGFDDEEVNKLCEDNNVSDLPHVQILDDQMNVLDKAVGDILACHVLTLLEKHQNDRSAQHHKLQSDRTRA